MSVFFVTAVDVLYVGVGVGGVLVSMVPLIGSYNIFQFLIFKKEELVFLQRDCPHPAPRAGCFL